MRTSRPQIAVFISLVSLLAASLTTLPTAAATPDDASQDVRARAEAQRDLDVRDSVVQIFTTSRLPDLRRPWTRQTPREATGTGFVISGNRILTNAHVVDYARRILVQPYQSSDELEARVVAIARGIDLAVIELEDDSFFESHPPLSFAADLPRVGTTVNAYGYPLGGDALSITEGIVNRIEFTGYAAGTRGLRIQVDAALNPGNSGGPVLAEGADGPEVVGVVFSGVPGAENTGYLIPIEEVNKFLDDADDGTYDGSPQLVYNLQTAESPSVRSFLGLDRDVTGLIVSDPEDHEALRRWDVITAIGPHDIANDGMVFRGDLRFNWTYYVDEVSVDAPAAHEAEGAAGAAAGEADDDRGGGRRGKIIPLTVFRDGELIDVALEAKPQDSLLFTPLNGRTPEYAIVGPMCFTPIYRETAEALLQLGAQLALNDHPAMGRFGEDEAFEGEELVTVVPPFFPHRLTKGYQLTRFPVVDKVNGVKIKNLVHLVETITNAGEDYLIFEWQNDGMELLVFPKDKLLQATEDVLEDNDIRSQYSPAVERALAF
ncbi:MAG: trypsin-like peptidase domain-containing protein [Planctomycetota bacterium]